MIFSSNATRKPGKKEIELDNSTFLLSIDLYFFSFYLKFRETMVDSDTNLYIVLLKLLLMNRHLRPHHRLRRILGIIRPFLEKKRLWMQTIKGLF